ncbi:MAG: plasmid replication initiator TrfA [Castellaniella sp.]|uniref:plasmid replication initiator TrfA n=1 Tax=Castellaniella sp. TaxID=1955812 RepID=UPI003A88A37B
MAAESVANIERQAAETPQQMFLPGMHEFMRAMPNHLARSSLFVPIGKGNLHDGSILVSRPGAEIRFKGKQLDEAQADVWMQCMKEAQRQPLGTPVVINRSAFLREIGRKKSGQAYKWLHSTMQDLAFAMLVIKVTSMDGQPKLSIGNTRALHMIAGFDYDEEAEAYTFTIDPRWPIMYENREFALIDWGKRMKFGRNQHMAKTLQRLLATSNEPIQRYALDWLKAKMGYTSPMRKFRDALSVACVELKRLGPAP